MVTHRAAPAMVACADHRRAGRRPHVGRGRQHRASCCAAFAAPLRPSTCSSSTTPAPTAPPISPKPSAVRSVRSPSNGAIGEPGLGAAYRDGFRYALEHGYDAVIEMDADLSHDPASLPPLLAALDAGADLAIGTRYIDGGATPGWPWRRRMLSRAGGEYARSAAPPAGARPDLGVPRLPRRAAARLRARDRRRAGLRLPTRDAPPRAAPRCARGRDPDRVPRPRRRSVEALGRDRPGGVAHGQRAAAPSLAAGGDQP